MPNKFRRALLAGAVSAFTYAADAADHDAAMHAQGHSKAQVADSRPLVRLPHELRIHTLANMRDHLLALQEIQDALASGEYALAGDIAEERLGMSSLKRHGAHDLARYMPEGMRAIGSGMHRTASRFALAAHDVAAGAELKPALAALARVTQQCVACHAGYRVH